MSIKRRIGAFALIMVMCTSTTPAFAESQTSIGGAQNNILNNQSISNPTLRTVDGQEVHIPDASELEKVSKEITKKARSFSADEYS